MLPFERFISGPQPTNLSLHAIPRLENTIPTQGPDWLALLDDGGQVLLRHLPAERDQAPQTRQGVS